MDAITTGPETARWPSLAAPHGAYRCAGEDRWIAIAVTNEQEWNGLVSQMGNPSWAADDKFRSMAGRVANQDELDRAAGTGLGTRKPSRYRSVCSMLEFQLGVCQTAEDRVERDPQLRHLKWLIPLPHSEIGNGR